MPNGRSSAHGETILLVDDEDVVREPTYMSGYTANALVYQGVLKEGVRLIGKPFPPRDLLAKVREILDAQINA
ncbi:hypothetical protein [Pengzhenrongella sp.]|uniref:hypothetical protein n=1 Tax=Pengzhenrongella sp. TaxID=2888820 RepID=UPI002F947602